MKKKKRQVIVLVSTSASSQKEAEAIVAKYMATSAMAVYDTEPKIHASIDYWAIAEVKAK